MTASCPPEKNEKLNHCSHSLWSRNEKRSK